MSDLFNVWGTGNIKRDQHTHTNTNTQIDTDGSDDLLRDMTHPDVWHGAFIYVPRLIHMRDMTHSYAWYDAFICVTWLIQMCDMVRSYVCHNSFICMPRLVHTCDMSRSETIRWHVHGSRQTFICVTWLTHVCNMTHSCVTWLDSRYVRQDSFICLLRSCSYGVATISRFLKIIGLFCRISSLL